MGKKEEKPIYQKISEALKADKRTNRWLMDELKDYGFYLTDTQMSNRLSGIIDFTFDEAAACVKILKIPVSVAISI